MRRCLSTVNLQTNTDIALTGIYNQYNDMNVTETKEKQILGWGIPSPNA